MAVPFISDTMARMAGSHNFVSSVRRIVVQWMYSGVCAQVQYVHLCHAVTNVLDSLTIALPFNSQSLRTIVVHIIVNHCTVLTFES